MFYCRMLFYVPIGCSIGMPSDCQLLHVSHHGDNRAVKRAKLQSCRLSVQTRLPDTCCHAEFGRSKLNDMCVAREVLYKHNSIRQARPVRTPGL